MRLGPHTINPTKDSIEWSRRAPIVKTLNNISGLQVAQAGAVTVHRAYFNVYEQDAADPQGAFDRIMQQLGGFRPAYVELFNEWRQRIIWNLEGCLQFTWECVKLFHAVGLKVSGFSNSTGQPEMEDVIYMRDWTAPDGALIPFAGVDAWSLHEYWGNQGFSTWNALRYRRYHELLNGQHPPIIISECGRDRVEGGKGGWMNDGLSGDQYLAELLAYNAEIEKDAYVIGATPFTSGPTDDWHAFDMDGISPKIPGGLPPTEVYMPDYNPDPNIPPPIDPYPDEPPAPMPAPEYKFQLGFEKYALRYPAKVGVATSDLNYDDRGNAWQYSSNGLLFWHKRANKVVWFADPLA